MSLRSEDRLVGTRKYLSHVAGPDQGGWLKSNNGAQSAISVDPEMKINLDEDPVIVTGAGFWERFLRD